MTPGSRRLVHPGEAALRRWALEGRDDKVGRHVSVCPACRAEVEVRQALALAPAVAAGGAGCPPAEELVAWALGGLATVEDERRIDRHLTACWGCAVTAEGLTQAQAKRGRLPASPPAGRGPDLLARLKALVAFEMPQRLVLTTRRVAAPAGGPAYDQGMARYAAGDFPGARAGLEAALAAGERAPDLRFYLGVCRLAAGDGDAAVAALEAAVRARARLGEYRFFLAQALLAAGRGDDARRQLRRTAALPGSFRESARDLGRRLDELLGEPA